MQAVYDMVDRTLPGSKNHFVLSITRSTSGKSEVSLSDTVDGKINIDATTASELAYGVGHYLREYCNMTIGWKRGGGSDLHIPKSWPTIGGGTTVTKTRIVPWSYMMNVCTHSYSLVWCVLFSVFSPPACPSVCLSILFSPSLSALSPLL